MLFPVILTIASALTSEVNSMLLQCTPRRIAVHREFPEYPTSPIHNRGVDGFVEVIVEIDKEGKVVGVLVVKSEPLLFFDDVATDAAEKRRFEAADTRCWQTLHFSLELER